MKLVIAATLALAAAAPLARADSFSRHMREIMADSHNAYPADLSRALYVCADTTIRTMRPGSGTPSAQDIDRAEPLCVMAAQQLGLFPKP